MERITDWRDRSKSKYCTGEKCIPDCPYYAQTGEISDEQIIKEFDNDMDIVEIEDYKKELGEKVVQSIIKELNSSGS